MKVVIFGLTVSSSWGNGHATLWRGLCRALAHRRHKVTFFERDVPYYATHRDLQELPDGKLVLYTAWPDVVAQARRELAGADVGMVTSYCPDGIAATDTVMESGAKLRVFYDLDTPVTLTHLQAGEPLSYIGARGLRDFDVVLSYTGGAALGELQNRLGAKRVAPLYGSVDPEIHRPVPSVDGYRADLSYLGTYAQDRQQMLEELFIRPARIAPRYKFLIGGAQYPPDFPWTANIHFARHVAPGEHPAFYCSSRLTLSVTRRAMAEMGYCPSGRLFEAAACGTPIVTDYWEGLEQFFEPESQILVATTAEEVLQALDKPEQELTAISTAARDRVLAEHTAEKRAQEFESALSQAFRRESDEPCAAIQTD